jgi:kynurenine formamidase
MGRNRPGHYGGAWSPPSYTVDENHKIVGAVPPQPNNWGRWGADDQRGTTNLITPGVITSAAGLVRSGRTVALGIPIDAEAPIHFTRPGAVRVHTYSGSDYIAGSPTNEKFFEGMQWTDDLIFMALQGSTQWDGLAHIILDDAMYNGFWGGSVTSAGGAERNGIQHQRETLVGRGVLLDVARHRNGAGHLEGGEPITGAILDEVAAAQEVELRPGDMLLLRTGYLGHWYALDSANDYVEKTSNWWTTEPGLSGTALTWLYEHDIAAIACDNWALEVVPFDIETTRPFPVHQGAIPGLGLTIGEFWWLDDLGKACAEEGRWEFFLSAQPLNVTNASGTMLNPVAIF